MGAICMEHHSTQAFRIKVEKEMRKVEKGTNVQNFKGFLIGMFRCVNLIRQKSRAQKGLLSSADPLLIHALNF